MSHYNRHIFLCTNQKSAGKACCANAGPDVFFDYLKTRLLELELYGPGQVRVSKSGCLGRCSSGPCVVIYPEGVWYRYQSIADIDEIIVKHLINNERVTPLLIDT